MLVVDVLETQEVAAAWAEKTGFTFPVLLDEDGSVSTSYAPENVQPDLPRNQVPIASNLIVDKDGNVQFYSLLDSVNFDAKLVALKARLDELISEP